MIAAVIGAGPNGLSAALTLIQAGLDVTLFEEADKVGGGIRSAELTLPGLQHDICSSTHPFVAVSPFFLANEELLSGVSLMLPQVQLAHPLSDGNGVQILRSIDETASKLGRDIDVYRTIFGPLLSHFDTLCDDFLGPILRWPRDPVGMLRLARLSCRPAQRLCERFQTTQGRALFAGLSAHGFSRLDTPFSSGIALALGTAAHACGWPVIRGGTGELADRMLQAFLGLGGVVRLGHRIRNLEEVGDFDIAILDTSPETAAEILDERLSHRARQAYRSFKRGPGVFRMSLAVRGGIPWDYQPARLAGTVHVCGDASEVTESLQLVNAGKMPSRPFVLVSQQYLADPDRVRNNVVPIDLYAHVPNSWPHDATAQIMEQLERFAPGVSSLVLAVRAASPENLLRENRNFSGGDILTGARSARQLFFGPRITLKPYSTGASGIYLASAATPPGPGAHGMCGFKAAQAALRDLQLL